MTSGNLPLLNALGAKMDYLSQRQAVISQNIANANTPDYKAKDLQEMDFGGLLDQKSKGVSIVRTNKAHMSISGHAGSARVVENKTPWETSPDGNSVSMEGELIKANKIVMDYGLATSLYQKQLGLIRTAIGGR